MNLINSGIYKRSEEREDNLWIADRTAVFSRSCKSPHSESSNPDHSLPKNEHSSGLVTAEPEAIEHLVNGHSVDACGSSCRRDIVVMLVE